MSDTISILDGNTFVVSDRRGDIDASPTRPAALLRRHALPLALDAHGQRPRLSVCPPTTSTTSRRSSSWSGDRDGLRRLDPLGGAPARRRGWLPRGSTILNHGTEPMELEVRIEAAADFADLFEVKDGSARRGELYRSVEDGRLTLGYKRETFVRETFITARASRRDIRRGRARLPRDDRQPQRTGRRASTSWRARQGPWARDLEARTTAAAGDAGRATPRHGPRGLVGQAPRLVSSWDPLEQHLPAQPGRPRGAALLSRHRCRARRCRPPGLPWFMALFGRDSLITSYPGAAVRARAGARRRCASSRSCRARAVDDFRDEEPGKILHELRFGELTAFEERPHSPYLRLGRLDAAVPDPARRVRALDRRRATWCASSSARRAPRSTGSTSTATATATATSSTSGATPRPASRTSAGRTPGTRSRSRDGTLAPLPRATCEIQGYVYDAKLRCARLAREVWDDAALAERLEREAAELKERFNRDFWIAGPRLLRARAGRREAAGRLADVQHRPPAVERHRRRRQGRRPCVRAPDGRRAVLRLGRAHDGRRARAPTTRSATTSAPSGRTTTRSSRSGLRALRLSREEAAQIARGDPRGGDLLRRPPARRRSPATRASETRFPVEYPTACSPQAWATGAPLLMLRALLGPRAHRRAPARRRRRCPTPSAASSCWRHPGPLGVRPTPSAGGRLQHLEGCGGRPATLAL